MCAEEKTRITVDIFGTNYTLVGRSSTSYLRMIAKHVNDQMHLITNSFPKLEYSKIGVLTAVNITDEFFKLGKELEQLQAEQHTLIQADDKFKRLLERNQLLEINFSSLQEKQTQSIEQHHKLEAELNEAYEEVKRAEQRFQAQQERVQTVEQELSKIQDEQSRQQQALEEQHKQQILSEQAVQQELKNENDRLRQELEQAQQHSSSVQSQDQELITEHEKLKNEYEKLKREYNEWIQLVMDKEDPK